MKRQLAIQTNLPLSHVIVRIIVRFRLHLLTLSQYWFQKRRAKAKQLKKQEEFQMLLDTVRTEGWQGSKNDPSAGWDALDQALSESQQIASRGGAREIDRRHQKPRGAPKTISHRDAVVPSANENFVRQTRNVLAGNFRAAQAAATDLLRGRGNRMIYAEDSLAASYAAPQAEKANSVQTLPGHSPVPKAPKLFVTSTISQDRSDSKENCRALLVALDDRSRGLKLRSSKILGGGEKRLRLR